MKTAANCSIKLMGHTILENEQS